MLGYFWKIKGPIEMQHVVIVTYQCHSRHCSLHIQFLLSNCTKRSIILLLNSTIRKIYLSHYEFITPRKVHVCVSSLPKSIYLCQDLNVMMEATRTEKKQNEIIRCVRCQEGARHDRLSICWARVPIISSTLSDTSSALIVESLGSQRK